MEFQITENIVAEKDSEGRWFLKDIEKNLVSRELFISMAVIRQAIEGGYVTWEPGEADTLTGVGCD